MDLRELESYRLSDAVKFNDHLNPKLWGSDERLLPAVRERLLAIADDFREFLGIDLEIKDITISGSNAAYTYTPHSDIDLHLVVDLPRADESDVYRELFDAKKYQYNDQHDFKIGGYDVELYVQNANEPHHSQGIYSVLNNDWVRVPGRRKPEVNDISVKSKYEDLGRRIESAIKSGDRERMDAMGRKIRDLRQAGLDAHGEFGPENLAFKILRGNGTLQKLRDARLAAKDQEMSLQERKKKKKKTRYGFGGYYFPGYGYYGQTGEVAATDGGGDGGGESQHEDYDPNAEPPGPEFKPEMPPGTILVNVSDVYDWYKLGQDISDLGHADPKSYGKGAPQTVLSFGSEPIEHMYKQDLDRLGLKTLDIDRKAKQKDPEGAYRMDEDQDPQDILRKFIAFASGQLGIDHMPKIKFRRDPAWSERNNTFGRYKPEENTLYVSLANRHPLDIMRTVAHELTHHRQNEISPMPDHSGDTGSDWENEANAAAGIIMRRFSDLNPEYFGNLDEGIRSKLGALATAACVAGTPGCATTGADAIQGAQAIGRAIQATKPYGTASRGDIIRAGAKEEFQQAMKDWIRNGRQGTKPSPSPELVDQWRREAQSDMRRESIQTPVSKDAKAHDDYYVFLQKKANLGRPLTRQEQEFIKTYRLASQMRKQVAEASGYIPTEREKNDPRFSMALTQDIRPGETGRQANKLGLRTDSQGRPQLLMKKLNNLLESVKADEDLFEVKMSPGELQRWAASDEAEGIQAGFEAELIFRDAGGGDDEEDYQPDYDMDERPGSIDEVIDFFTGGENGIGSGTANRLRDGLYEEFVDWREEAIADEWSNAAEDQVTDYMETNVWGDDSIQDQYREQAAEELGIETSEQSAEQAEAIEKLAREKFEAEVQEQIEEEGRYYDDAREYFRDMMADSSDYDEGEFLSERYRYMSDIENAYGLDWPYWSGGERQGGERTVDDIANSLSGALGGAEVRASSGYHSTTRKPGRWIVEPDGSLDPDDSSEETGLEVVSPPMPLPQALKALRTVIDWANSDGDAYTNSSTGLHMGISIPHKGGDVDYVKLIMFMGDKYVLDQFGRAANSYCRSALDKLQEIQRRRRGVSEQEGLTGAEKTAAAMDLMKKNLIELAARYVRDDVGTGKYTSAHAKDGYIEFRSPGGDYLAMDDRDESALQNTMLRFARAMYLAGRPDLERKEYGKKLYKLIDAQNDEALKLFVDYSLGKIDQEELKKSWARQVLTKEQPRKEQKYEVYDQDTGEVLEVVSGRDDADLSLAVSMAIEKYSDRNINIRKQEEPGKEPSRRAKVAKKIVDRPTVWHVENMDTGKILLIAAANVRDAQYDAMRQDPEFERISREDPDSFIVKPATAAEVRQYQVQQADNEKDSEQVQRRVQGTSGEQRYRVQWTERRNGEEVQDSLTLDAANANAAMANVRRVLEIQGRDVISIQANLVGSTQDLARQRADQAAWRDQREYQIYNRSTGQPVVAFIASGDEAAMERLEQYRQRHPALDVGVRTGGVTSATRHQLPQGEFTGRWIVKDRRGNIVYTFSGVGNSQADANRTANTWLMTQGDRFDDQGPFDVVPEMT